MEVAIFEENGKKKLDFERIKGIISKRYKLYGNDKAIDDLDFKWNKQELIDMVTERPFESCQVYFYKKVEEIFDDLSYLQSNYNDLIKRVFDETIRLNTFRVIAMWSKKIACYCYNFDLIDRDTWFKLKNLKRNNSIKKISQKAESKYITENEHMLVMKFLEAFYIYVLENKKHLLNIPTTMLLKYYLSNLGLRISSIESIEKSFVRDNELRFMVYKSRTEEGFRWNEYSREFIGEPYFKLLQELAKEPIGDERLFQPLPKSFISTHFIRKCTNEKRLDLLEGLKIYNKWKKNTHSGRHGFINRAHDYGMSNEDISAITLQTTDTIDRYYTKAMSVKKRRLKASLLFNEKSKQSMLDKQNNMKIDSIVF